MLSTEIIRFHNGYIKSVVTKLGRFPVGSEYTFWGFNYPRTYTLRDKKGNLIQHIRFHHYPKNAIHVKSIQRETELVTLFYDTKGNTYRKLIEANGITKDYDVKRNRFFINRIELHRETIDMPIESITCEIILGDRREVRQLAYLYLLGAERFFNLIKYHKNFNTILVDVFGTDRLYQVRFKKQVVNIVVFTCPSTGTLYYHYIPLQDETHTDIDSVVKAKKWMFTLPRDIEYTPVQEG